MKTCKLSFDVTYDPATTDAVKLAEAFDFMLGKSLGSNVLDGHGPTEVGTITVASDEADSSGDELSHEQLKSMLANHDEFQLPIVNRKYADIRSQLAEMGYPVDIQIVMVVVDQMASSDPYFVRLAKDLAKA